MSSALQSQRKKRGEGGKVWCVGYGEKQQQQQQGRRVQLI